MLVVWERAGVERCDALLSMPFLKLICVAHDVYTKLGVSVMGDYGTGIDPDRKLTRIGADSV